ncbi:hypothetical protein BDN67DRAFT_1071496 [Paxillus ammoniavirescens]|nr:hypothetical protein BDN67DRAFT_1071496 [Paxillus ammoniavirescens]
MGDKAYPTSFRGDPTELVLLCSPVPLNCHPLHKNMTAAFAASRPAISSVQASTQQEIDREIAQLKKDSARDVRLQLEQQRLAESESKVEEDIRKESDRVLSPTGEAVEAKASPVLSLAEHGIEAIINDSAADVEDLEEDLRTLRERLGARVKAEQPEP